MGRALQRIAGLYLHVPFCRAKCHYCDFNSRPMRDQQELTHYVQALQQDINLSAALAHGYELISVYFGGGTPSLLSPAQLNRLLGSVCRSYALSADAEITLEVNPGTVAPSSWRGLRKSGINRLSIGIQSFDDDLLKLLGRIHTGAQAKVALKAARCAGFDNISADLIYGIPGQTIKHWSRDLQQLISLAVDHVSFYDLTFEPGTPLWKQRHSLSAADNDSLARMYRCGCLNLEQAGYRQYEISSFAMPGKEARHNQLYWRNEPTIGCGAGAFSYVNNRRFSKCPDIERYMSQARQERMRHYQYERLTPERRFRETLILNLRLMKGISRQALITRTNLPVPAEIDQTLDQLQREGLMRRDQSVFQLTRKGILWYDNVAASLL